MILMLFFAFISATFALDPPSNLPPAPEGVFTVSGSSIINADVDAAWNLLTNFTNYPNWNPFVRYVQVYLPDAEYYANCCDRSQVIINEWGVEQSTLR